jgi:hypothetical protein
MEQYDYDIDQSLRVINGAANARREEESGTAEDLQSVDSKVGNTSTSVSVSANSSAAASLSEYGDASLTLNTRRRLIRKPLPDLPSSQKRDAGSTSTDADNRTEGVLRHDELREASHSSVFAHHTSKKAGLTLSQARQRTRDLEEKERAMIEWWPSVPFDVVCAQHDTDQALHLNLQCRRHLRNIIQASLQATMPESDKELTLNLTTSIELAIVACLRSVATTSTLAGLHQTCSILWRVEALVRSEEQLKDSKGGIANVLDLLGLRWTSFVPWRKGGSVAMEDNNIKALSSLEELLSIRPLLASRRLSSSSSSVNATVNTEQRRRKRDVAMQLLNSAFLTPAHSKVDPIPNAAGSEKSTTQKKHSLAGPSFALKPATPTVALATKDDDHSYFPQQSQASAQSNISGNPPAGERPSMLADRLSMQLRNASRSNSETSVPQVKAATLRDSSARSSRSSFNMLNDTQEKEPLTLTACSIYHCHEEGSPDENADRPSRANTIKGTLKRLENLSTISTASDETVTGNLKQREVADNQTTTSGRPNIEWVPDRFEGCPLRRNPFALTADIAGQKTDETIARNSIVGGTFVTKASAQHFEAIKEALELALYAAASMLLETNFLVDFGLPPQVEKAPPLVNDVLEPQSDNPLDPSNSAEEGCETSSNAESPAHAHSHPHSHWHRGIWHVFGHHDNFNKPLEKGEVPSSPTRDRPAPLSRMRRLWHAFAPSSSTSIYAQQLGDKAIESGDMHRSEINEGTPHDTSDVRDKEGQYLPTTIAYEKPSHLSAYRAGKDACQTQGDVRAVLMSSCTFQYATVYGVDLTGSHASSAKKEGTISTTASASAASTPTDSRAPSQTVPASQPLSADTWSTLSRQSDSTNASSHAGLPSAAVASQSSASNARSVQFYEHEDQETADTSLGQALEEMAARTTALQHTMSMKTEKSRTSTSLDIEATSHTFKIAQYLTKQDKVFVCGSIVARAVPSPPSKSGTSTPLHSRHDSMVSNENVEISFNEKSSNDRDYDVKRYRKTTATRSTASLVRPIQMWHADVRTGRQSVPVVMSDATYLASYAMFLEALTKRAEFTRQSPPLIGDDLDDTDALGESDDPKHDLVRMFKIGDVLLKFHVQSVNLFDMLIEGPVVVTLNHPHEAVAVTIAGSDSEQNAQFTELLATTRAEIRKFYASLKQCVSQLEQLLVARELDTNGKTIKIEAPSLGRSSVRTVFTDTTDAETASFDESIADSTSTGYTGAAAEPLSRLERVTSSIRKGEFQLYEMLKSSDADLINDVRTRFCELAVSAKERLRAWSRKHLTKAEMEQLGNLIFDEPEYFGHGKYAFPGSRYLLRQDEPLSIIAYSLSSKDYKKELASASHQATRDEVRNWRISVAAVFPHHDPFPVFPASATTKGSEHDKDSPKLRTKQLDPDQDEDFSVAVPLQISTKRKRRVKEASMLSLRIRSSAASAEGEQEQGLYENVSDWTYEKEQMIGVDTNANERRRSDSTLTLHQAPAQSHESTFETKTILLESSASSVTDSSASAATVHDAEVEQTPQPSRLLAERESNSVKPYGDLTPSRPSVERQAKSNAVPHARSKASPHVKHTLVSGSLKISCVSWFAEEFAKLRQQWGVEHDFIASLSRSKMWSNLGGKSKSGFYLSGDDKWIAKQLLNIWTVDEKEAFLEFAPAYLQYMTNSVVNDCPTLLVKIAGVYSLKIKDVKTHEVKLKLSVQVLENVFSGDFGETIRFDLKGIRERRALTSAKKVGAEGDAQKSGESSGKSSADVPSVWWDGEWIETMAPRAYVKETDKVLFDRALQNDLHFLTASRMMDYSLLVGVNEVKTTDQAKDSNKPASFRVRIVDFLGAWTLVKQLESSGKKAIKSQTPTVIPPHEYADRFRRAMMSYFIASPSI